MVKDEIINEVKESVQFTVVVNETRDAKKMEYPENAKKMSFGLRYYYNGVVSFYGVSRGR